VDPKVRGSSYAIAYGQPITIGRDCRTISITAWLGWQQLLISLPIDQNQTVFPRGDSTGDIGQRSRPRNVKVTEIHTRVPSH
jgi:hypothetical protein